MDLHDEIARVAYGLYQSRGCIPMQDLDDWLEAEEIVLVRHAGQELEEPEEEEAPEETAEVKKKKVTEGSDVEEYQVAVG